MSFIDQPPDATDAKKHRYRVLGYFLVITLVVGASASLFTEPSIPTWYAALNHPAIAPPNWVFAPVWTTLYILMAVAAWRVWLTGAPRTTEMTAFGVQLALNFAWSGVFFGLHQIGPALVEIAALEVAILATTILFWRRDHIAGLLFLPYLAWAGFAALLTWQFWRLNP